MGTEQSNVATLSLAAAGGTEFFALAGAKLIGFKLSAPTVAAAGLITFRLANSATDLAPNAMAHPQVAVVAGTAINEFVELVDLAANFVQVYWAPTVAEAVDLTISLTVKE